jgi:DNA-binding transcriptional regulator YiaG
VATKSKTQHPKQRKGKTGVAAKKAGPRGFEPPRLDSSVRDLRERLGLTQDLFARISGLSVRTIADWEGGKAPAAGKAQRLNEIRRLQRALSGVMRAEFIGSWLKTPNEAFSGLKPIEVIERGEVDRIWRMIYELESGIPT